VVDRAEHAQLGFAGHELDLRRRELRRGGQVVPVEPQVYDLLVHLVRNHDRVVSKDELLDTIWNGRFVSVAALSSRINAARKAIGDDGDRQALIKTIHRRGFRFIGAVRQAAGDPTEAALPERPADRTAILEEAATSCRPSIAVLPFANLGKEPGTDYFSYGLTEDVIRLLARNRWLDVLSRHSAVGFKGQETDPREIGAALGIRYLVQGTVMRHG
jgi:DNA-binding winged helix-turn-helix (wHTH) protein